MTIEFLLRQAFMDSPQREQMLKASQRVLNAMSHGGMYDVIGGGLFTLQPVLYSLTNNTKDCAYLSRSRATGKLKK